MFKTNRLNQIEHAYPGAFYNVLSVFVGGNVTLSVLAMRLFSIVLLVALTVATLFVIPRKVRQTLLISLVITAVPLGVFIIGSTNPSSWAYATPVLAFSIASAIREMRLSSRIFWGQLGVLIVVSAVAVAARADAAVFTAVAIFAGLLIARMQGNMSLRTAILPALVAVIGVATTLVSRQLSHAATGIADGNPIRSLMDQLQFGLEVLAGLPALFMGAVGGWGLGWLDTPMPSFIGIAGVGLLFFFTLNAASTKKPRDLLIPMGLLIFAIAVAFVVQYQTMHPVGSFVQPRYILPLLPVIVAAFVLPLAQPTVIAPRAILIAASVSSLSYAVALYTNIRRYSVGLGDSYYLNAGWQPLISGYGVFFLGSVSMTLFLTLGYVWFYSKSADQISDLYIATNSHKV